MTDDQRAASLVKGTLDLLILQALSEDPMHGYGITAWLENHSGGRLGVEDTAVYQALQRLRGRRLVNSEWGVSENNRRARYYRLTARGERQLSRDTATWRAYVESVEAILATAAER